MSLDAYGHKQTNQILDFDERHCIINEYKSAYVLKCIYGHKQTNQILDFDERHCINEYKSAYVLRCRSTITSYFRVIISAYVTDFSGFVLSFVLPCAYAYVASEDISNPLTSQIVPWFVYL